MNKVMMLAGVFTVGFCVMLKAEDIVVSASVTLKDGSLIKGELCSEVIQGATLFEDSLSIPFGMVRSVNVKDDWTRLVLTNQDVVSVKVINGSFGVKSMLGNLSIATTNINSMALSQRQSKEMVGNGELGLIYYCTFDDAGSIMDPAVGPKGRLGNASFVEGKVGKAARIPRYGNAGIVDLPAGFFGKTGCVEFWAKIDVRKDYFGVCDPRLFNAKFVSGNEIMMEYSDNNGGAKGGLNIRLPGLGAVSSHRCGGHLYSEILGDSVSEWHHYAVSWSESKCTFYIDGRALPMAHYYGEHLDENRLATEACALGFPNHYNADGSQPRSCYLLDEFKIWNYEKTEFDL